MFQNNVTVFGVQREKRKREEKERKKKKLV